MTAASDDGRQERRTDKTMKNRRENFKNQQSGTIRRQGNRFCSCHRVQMATLLPGRRSRVIKRGDLKSSFSSIHHQLLIDTYSIADIGLGLGGRRGK